MPKPSIALSSLPPAVAAALAELGEDLAVARKRRRESRQVWAQRLGVSVPTLTRMERGDPSVAAGIYATALWMIGRAGAIAELASPALDHGALEQEVQQARRRSQRRPASGLDGGEA